jgi:hypothetical protein
MPAARTAPMLFLLMSTLTMGAGAQPRQLPPVAPAGPELASPSARTIRVEGMGEVKVAPDEAFIDLGVETAAPTAKAAGAENARKMEKVINALVQGGIPRKEIETRNYAVYPEYTPQTRPGEEPKVKGYRVSNTVEVHVRELARVGALLDTALGAGANRVESVRFGLSKPEAVQGEALRSAVERASEAARVLATALGVKLGPVLDASTVLEPREPMPMPMMARAEAGAAGDAVTPIQPQEQTVRARVTLVFAIEPGAGR